MPAFLRNMTYPSPWGHIFFLRMIVLVPAIQIVLFWTSRRSRYAPLLSLTLIALSIVPCPMVIPAGRYGFMWGGLPELYFLEMVLLVPLGVIGGLLCIMRWLSGNRWA
jgi:hypothetical protein